MPNEPTQYQYQAIAVEQQPGGPVMYLLGVPADELLEWADVPSAKADYMAGYQRVYNKDRAKDVTEFLSLSPKNVIPGAIIVTVDSSRVSIDPGNDPVTALKIDASEFSFEDQLISQYERFKSRMSVAELESANAEESDDGDDDTGAGDSDEVENAGIPDSYLASLAFELGQAIDDFDSLAESRQIAITNYILSVSKPGLIIDGQHRVFGAKDVADNEVVLPIVLLPGLDFAEQVFHFYVLNNKAKPLTPTELRRTISTSLTNQEIDDLWQRFDDAGINPEATRWTHKLQTNPKSPFQGLIDFGLGGDGFLKENVAFQLVSKFVNMPKKYKILYAGVPAFEHKDDDRLDYFYGLWNAIRSNYPSVWEAGVEDGGNQLFMKASLLVLQEYVLDSLVQYTVIRQMDGAESPLKDLGDLEKAVKGILNFLPAAFFATEWQVKQIDTTEGHKFLRSQMELAVQNQGTKLGLQQLFKKVKQK